MECDAKSKRSGVKCKGQAVTGSPKCRMHGGKTPVGIASPHFVTGRYSKNLPTRLSADYQDFKDDPDLIIVRDEKALTQSRVNDLLARVDSGESGEAWRALRTTFLEGEKQLAIWNMGGIDAPSGKQTFFECWEQIGIYTSEGVQDYQAWDEVLKALELTRRFSETETKRIKEAQKSITSERAMVLVGALVGIVNKHVTDRSILAAISADVRAITADGSGG